MIQLQQPVLGSLQGKQKLIFDVLAKRDVISMKMSQTAPKLALFFRQALPSDANKLRALTAEETAQAIMNLSIAFDVYKTNAVVPDALIESSFEGIVATVREAKMMAIKKNRNKAFALRVNCMAGLLKKSALEKAGMIPAPTNSGKKTVSFDLDNGRVEDLEKTRKMAVRRYRAFLGMGKQKIQREQLVALISDLLLLRPSIKLLEIEDAVDKLLEDDEGVAKDEQADERA